MRTDPEKGSGRAPVSAEVPGAESKQSVAAPLRRGGTPAVSTWEGAGEEAGVLVGLLGESAPHPRVSSASLVTSAKARFPVRPSPAPSESLTCPGAPTQ